ncbi:peptidase T, partial [Vibrio parahaemolyticus]|nr:peptidase T [Vibrio parahaemolyticus]
AKFQVQMPQDQTPETTEGYEGFFHLKSAEMGVARSELGYIIRDFDRQRLEERKAFMQKLVDEMNTGLRHGSVELKIKDSYYNMREMVEPYPHIIELAKQAMEACDVEP